MIRKTIRMMETTFILIILIHIYFFNRYKVHLHSFYKWGSWLDSSRWVHIEDFEKVQVENNFSFPSLEVGSFEMKGHVEFFNAFSRLLNNEFQCWISLKLLVNNTKIYIIKNYKEHKNNFNTVELKCRYQSSKPSLDLSLPGYLFLFTFPHVPLLEFPTLDT